MHGAWLLALVYRLEKAELTIGIDTPVQALEKVKGKGDLATEVNSPAICRYLVPLSELDASLSNILSSSESTLEHTGHLEFITWPFCTTIDLFHLLRTATS